MTDHLTRARAFVDERFPQAEAAFLGGSAAMGRATDTSDLDILVLLPDRWAEIAFVETTTYQGQLVEAFVYGEPGLREWIGKGRRERRPVLDRLIAHGVTLRETATAERLRADSEEALAAGPAALTEDECRLRRYSLSATLDDLADATEPGERFVIAATVWREAAELALLLDRRWLGTGKWLLRELGSDTDRFGLIEWTTDQDPTELLTLGKHVLQAAGGYLQEGFVRGERPPDL